MKVVVTRRTPEIAIQMLRAHFDVVYRDVDSLLDKAELMTMVSDADAVLSSLTDTIDQEVVDVMKKTKIVMNLAVGYNNLDVNALKAAGIVIANTPDVLSDTTAETAWSLLMAVSRHIVAADRFVREGKWKGFSSDLFLGQDVYGKSLGIIGAGRIGRRFAEKARGFNMHISYHSRHRHYDFEKMHNAEFKSLENLMSSCDIISLHVPFNNETQCLIGEKELALMKPNAILINTSRGAVIDEKALIQTLQERKIFGAGLDVYENEPHVPAELLALDNVVLLPHIGSASVETRNQMAVLAARNIIEVLQGRQPLTPIDSL